MFRDQGKYDPAREQFERSLKPPKHSEMMRSEIGALIELSFLLSTRGSISESADFAVRQ
jgi:hypothetical protein